LRRGRQAKRPRGASWRARKTLKSAVLGADAFGPVLEAGGEVAGEVAVGLAAEEAHDVGALEVQGGVADERGIDGGEGRGRREEDVGAHSVW
jgi:hypothetical protein